MKILVAHARYSQPGGEEAVIDAQESALSARGHTVVRYEVDNEGLSRVKLAVNAAWSRGATRAITDVVASERPEVLHVHNNFHQLSPSIYGAAKARGVAVVQHLHNARLACINAFFERDGALCTDCVGRRITWPGVAHRCYRDSRAESLAATAIQLGHRSVNAHRAVDRFVAVSAALRDALVRADVVPDAKTLVCHNGVAEPAVQRHDGGYALFVGRIAEEKGIQVMLDAAASVPELALRVAGDGPSREAFAEQAARRGLHHVRFLGRLERADLDAQLAGARVTLAPSIGFDPLPTAIVEAAAAGVATIGSDIGGIPEIVGDAGVLVPAGDPVALGAALRRAYDEPASFAAMGDAARSRYRERFTLGAFGARLEAIYTDALAAVQGQGL